VLSAGPRRIVLERMFMGSSLAFVPKRGRVAVIRAFVKRL
jgi:hypothetical protein